MIIKDEDVILINEYEEVCKFSISMKSLLSFQVKLDLDTLEEYSLFSGMFCAVTGTNPTGAAFVVEKIQSFDFGPTEDIAEIKMEPQAKIQNTSKNFVPEMVTISSRLF